MEEIASNVAKGDPEETKMEIMFYTDDEDFSYELCIDAVFFENYRKFESLYFSNIENDKLLEKEIRAKNKHGIPLKIVSGKFQLKDQPLTKDEFETINQILHEEDRMITVKYFCQTSRSNVCEHFNFQGTVHLPNGERIEMM